MCNGVGENNLGKILMNKRAELNKEKKDRSMKMDGKIYYTGIGTRNLPDDYKEKIKNIAIGLDKLGFILRSGGADGCDLSFENNHQGSKEIFIPWKGFNNSDSNLHEQNKDASNIARENHPAYEKLKPAVKKLMDRNVHQVLGKDLKTPSQFIICYTEDGVNNHTNRTSKTGGTGLAISVASKNNIPIYNIRNKKDYNEVMEIIETGVIKPKLVGRECKFVTYLPEDPGVRQDTHIVKEKLHYSDGTIKPNLRIVENFLRPFWITKQHKQNHKDKKESEELENLNMYKSTQSDLAKSIATRLGPRFVGVNDMRTVLSSPYLYGTGASTESLIKAAYQKNYPDLNSPNLVCALDIENDIDKGFITVITVS
jgi:hypothetical protein